MSKIIILRGPYCAGKTTWSLKYCSKNKNTIRLCLKDFIETISCNTKESGLRAYIHALYKKSIIEAIKNDINIIIDNENFTQSSVDTIISIASRAAEIIEEETGDAPFIDIIIKTFETPLGILMRRNSQMANSKSPKKIVQSYQYFNKERNKDNK